MNDLIQRMQSRYPITNVHFQREDLVFCTVTKEQAVALITRLRDRENFRHLVFLTAVDYIERDIFQLTYLLHNYERHSDLGVRVEIDRAAPAMESIHHLWEQAATYQRELREMFGIDFPGSPRIEESFILEGWDSIPPMRKDFDTRKYSEETYFPRPGRKTEDPETYMKQQLYPESEV